MIEDPETPPVVESAFDPLGCWFGFDGLVDEAHDAPVSQRRGNGVQEVCNSIVGDVAEPEAEHARVPRAFRVPLEQVCDLVVHTRRCWTVLDSWRPYRRFRRSR